MNHYSIRLEFKMYPMCHETVHNRNILLDFNTPIDGNYIWNFNILTKSYRIMVVRKCCNLKFVRKRIKIENTQSCSVIFGLIQ